MTRGACQRPGSRRTRARATFKRSIFTVDRKRCKHATGTGTGDCFVSGCHGFAKQRNLCWGTKWVWHFDHWSRVCGSVAQLVSSCLPTNGSSGKHRPGAQVTRQMQNAKCTKWLVHLQRERELGCPPSSKLCCCWSDGACMLLTMLRREELAELEPGRSFWISLVLLCEWRLHTCSSQKEKTMKEPVSSRFAGIRSVQDHRRRGAACRYLLGKKTNPPKSCYDPTLCPQTVAAAEQQPLLLDSIRCNMSKCTQLFCSLRSLVATPHPPFVSR